MLLLDFLAPDHYLNFDCFALSPTANNLLDCLIETHSIYTIYLDHQLDHFWVVFQQWVNMLIDLVKRHLQTSSCCPHSFCLSILGNVWSTYTKNYVTNRLNSRVGRRVSRLQWLCVLINLVKRGDNACLCAFDLHRACRNNVVGSDADTKVVGCALVTITLNCRTACKDNIG